MARFPEHIAATTWLRRTGRTTFFGASAAAFALFMVLIPFVSLSNAGSVASHHNDVGSLVLIELFLLCIAVPPGSLAVETAGRVRSSNGDTDATLAYGR